MELSIWMNRMLLPDTVGTGGDSHTRFPIELASLVLFSSICCNARCNAFRYARVSVGKI